MHGVDALVIGDAIKGVVAIDRIRWDLVLLGRLLRLRRIPADETAHGDAACAARSLKHKATIATKPDKRDAYRSLRRVGAPRSRWYGYLRQNRRWNR